MYHVMYACYFNLLLIRNHSWIVTTVGQKDRNLWKSLLDNNEMVFKTGIKIYKPRLIMGIVREYTFCLPVISESNKKWKSTEKTLNKLVQKSTRYSWTAQTRPKSPKQYFIRSTLESGINVAPSISEAPPLNNR